MAWQGTSCGWSRVTVMLTAKIRGGLGHLSSSRPPYLSSLLGFSAWCFKLDSLDPSLLDLSLTLVICCISNHCRICHQIYFDSEAATLDKAYPGALCFPHWLHWAESRKFLWDHPLPVSWCILFGLSNHCGHSDPYFVSQFSWVSKVLLSHMNNY